MMNIVELTDGTELACNEAFEGVFERSKDGTWRQLLGTGQAPRFRNPKHFMRFVRSVIDRRFARRLSGGWR